MRLLLAFVFCAGLIFQARSDEIIPVAETIYLVSEKQSEGKDSSAAADSVAERVNAPADSPDSSAKEAMTGAVLKSDSAKHTDSTDKGHLSKAERAQDISPAALVLAKMGEFTSADTSIPEEDSYYYYTWPRKSSKITVPRKAPFLFCSTPLLGEFLPGFYDTLTHALQKRYQIIPIGLDSLAKLLDSKSPCFVMLAMELSGKTVTSSPGMKTLPFFRAFGLLVGIGAAKAVTEYHTALRFVVLDCANRRILFDAVGKAKASCGDALIEDEKAKEKNFEMAKRASFQKAVKDISRKLKIKAGVAGF